MYSIALTLVYAVLTFLVVLNHEIWTDEAQVWQIAKCLSLPELFGHLVNEGHPSLFYLLVMPLAKTGCSVFSMQILCWISSVFAVFILLQFSPFKWWCNIAIVLSCGFLYSFPVIARNYSIIPVLVFLSAILYSKRKEQPILYAITLFLLAHTHIIMYGFAGILTLLFGIETIKEKSLTKKNVTALSIMILALFLVFMQLHGTFNSNDFVSKPQLNIYTFSKFKHVIFNFISLGLSNIPANHLHRIHFLFAGILASIFVVLFKKSKKVFWICFLSVLFQISVYTLSYSTVMYDTRIFSAYLILIFGFWIAPKAPKNNKTDLTANILLSIFFLMTTLNGFQQAFNDYFRDYSLSKKTTNYIETNISRNDIIFCDAPVALLGIVAYLNKDYKIYNVSDMLPVTYIKWKKDMTYINSAQIWDGLLKDFVKSTKKLLNGRRIFIIQPIDYFQPIKSTNIVFMGDKTINSLENFVVLEYIYDK